ncbi:mechanosensitive ion channel family protein [Candidatus Peregrinibacteria bacterium]|jgi:small conductance mechanosensitive channel|nr:mechanosensitive ion channel family protein [Candidatus Peregrinibacteria bacterium]MBT7483878.1 mechanosensitive ion channel family protein [Candidatus Peregrinibacteria bacterium]
MLIRLKRIAFAGLLALSAMIWSLESVFAASITDQGSTAATETTSGLTEFFSTLWASAPQWIAAMIIFACSFVLAKTTKEKVVDRVSSKLAEDDQEVLVLIGRATYVAVLLLGVTISLKIAGIDLTAIIAAIGFGMGFAMQDLIMNFIAGIMILINRHFTLGDYIKVNDTIGQVVEIQSRATILKALDGTRVIVPNSQLFTNQVTSFTSNPFRRIEVEVGVEYRTDLAHATQIIKEALKEHEGILKEPGPAIVLDEFADSSINFLVRFWVDSKSNWIGAKSEVIHLIKKHFDEEGIDIPFPIRTLAFDKDTEDVMIPVFEAEKEELAVKKDQRFKEEVDLAAHVAAAAERSKTTQDIQPPKPAAKPHPPKHSHNEENVAAVDQASKSVQAEQDATPPPMPEAEKAATGASFLLSVNPTPQPVAAVKPHPPKPAPPEPTV